MSIQIPCPQCGRELKLPDRSLLGRKGKCPKCSHTFVLEEPPAVTLELAIPESTSGVSRPLVEIPPAPAFLSKLNANRTETPAATPLIHSEFVAIEQAALPNGAASKLKKLQRQNARRRNIGLAITSVILVLVGAVFLFSRQTGGKNSPAKLDAEPSASSETPSNETSWTNEGESEERSIDPANTEYAKQGPPTKGKPIELQYIPFGTQIVINIHPAELWKEMSLGEEIRYCAPPIAKLVETTLNDLFQRKPEQVEELLICLVPGPRGTLPDVAAVAHMVEDQKRSQLIEQFGQRSDSFGQPIYVSGNRAYMIVNPKTLVVCPKSQAQEMVQAIVERHPAEQIDPLLPMTDRDRHVTVIFTPVTLSLQDSWFPENVRPFMKAVLDWLGDETESLSWSFHLTEELFYSEILVRHVGVQAKTFERDFKDKLSKLAGTLVPLIEQMSPKEQGKRMVIGRVPAMVEVFSMATIARHGPQYVQFITPLPDRAAANMVLGTLLAWDESTRTDFSKSKPTATDDAGLPALVVDRLKIKIEADFRSTPFNEAFAYIGGEIKTPIDIDGDSLKLGGFTKNIKQDFRMDSSRAQDVIVKIFEESKGVDSNPEKNLVLVIDETKKRILVTTLAGAGRKGLKPVEFK